MKDFFLFWLPWYLYLAAVFFVSGIPRPEEMLHFTIKDFLMHPLEFFVLALLTFRAFRRSRMTFISARVVSLGVLFGLLYAALDEFHQSFVPGRTADILDWVYDAAGILPAVWIYHKTYGKQTAAVSA